MKYFQSFLFLICLSFLSTSMLAQEQASAEALDYSVDRVRPFIQIDKAGLKEAKTLNDINKRFESDWVKEYISVKISAILSGTVVNVLGDSDQLSPAQKTLMQESDTGTPIKVTVSYMPENNLSENSPKELNFTFTPEPENQAVFIGGEEKCLAYLQATAMDKISVESHQGYEMTAVRFTVDERGNIADVHIFGAEYQKGRKQEVESLLLKTISEMPCWAPARYQDGTTASQEFVLAIGNLQNCVLPMLGINRDL